MQFVPTVRRHTASATIVTMTTTQTLTTRRTAAAKRDTYRNSNVLNTEVICMCDNSQVHMHKCANNKNNNNTNCKASGDEENFNMLSPTVVSTKHHSRNNATGNITHKCNSNSNENNINNNTTNRIKCCKKFLRSNANSTNNLNRYLTVSGVLLLFAFCDIAQAALRNVNLFIEPPAVRRGQSVTLHCHYDLENAPLYSVKFYRGQLEFFRYTPGEFPNTKVFHYFGIKIDESVSNATQVVVRNVTFGLSGNFSCEVTADAPLFSTATAYALMQVVEFPDKRPDIKVEQSRYEPGDVLRANCSTPPSYPRAELRFTLNNIPVSSEETQYIRMVGSLVSSRLNLKLQLQAAHFAAGGNSHMINALSHGGNAGVMGVPYNTLSNSLGAGVTTGSLILRCVAQIGDLYQEYAESELGTPQKDPVPAKVTSSSTVIKGMISYFMSSSATMSAPNSNGNYAELLIAIGLALSIITTSHWMQRCRFSRSS